MTAAEFDELLYRFINDVVRVTIDGNIEIDGSLGYELRAALRGAGFAVVPAGFMEAAHDLRIAKGLTSHPLKLRFAEQRGMNGLDAVHAWMIAASDRFDAMVAAAEGGE